MFKSKAHHGQIVLIALALGVINAFVSPVQAQHRSKANSRGVYCRFYVH